MRRITPSAKPVASCALRLEVSIKTDPAVGFRGAIDRVESRSSRARTSSKTCSYITGWPMDCNSFVRRVARTSALAVTKNFTGASGQTTVAMSRPSKTTPLAPFGGFLAKFCCNSSKAARTGGWADVTDAASATGLVRRVGSFNKSGEKFCANSCAIFVAISKFPSPCRRKVVRRTG